MEIYVPRVTLVPVAGRASIALECGCGYAMPYPGAGDVPVAMECKRCGTTWRAVPFSQLEELAESRGGGS